MAVVETLIAATLILGFARKLTYLSAAAFSLLIWATAEGFGGPYTSGSSDVGTAIIYAVVFVGLLALSYHTGPSRYSVDYYLEQRFSWWWRRAELGGVSAPGWMRGRSLLGFMMGSGTDPGRVMGSLWADAPGLRVSATQAGHLGAQTPSGATLDRAGNRITFTTRTVNLVVEASPSMPAESFRIAGLTNPTIVVPAGARVSIELINADSDMAHGLVVTASVAASSWMPMMTAQPAFAGAALWFLGESTSAGMHGGTLSFTAATPGTYQHPCPVPGHAQEGLAGTLVVAG